MKRSKNRTAQSERGDEAVNTAKGLTLMHPYKILQEAIKAVPAVKYALGVAGIVAAISIITAFGIDLRIAALGAIVMFVLMVILVVFAKLSTTASRHFLVPVLVMMWSFLVVMIATTALLFSSVFFKQPLDLQYWVTAHSTRVLPERVATLPAGGVLKVAYTEVPPSPPAQFVRPRLEFGISAKRKDEANFSPLKEGDALASESDVYCVVARALSDGYLYIFQVDSSGKSEWLFPRNNQSRFSTGLNPLVARQTVQIPSADLSEFLFLDNTTGVEHIYAVFSAARWPELEEALSKPEALAPSSASTSAATVQEPNGLRVRGVGGTRISTKTSEEEVTSSVERVQSGKTFSLPFTNRPLEASGSYLVEERWFKHVAQ